ncbi:MAG: hypothetical protein R6X02_11315 [Enhygromyxa sp.]
MPAARDPRTVEVGRLFIIHQLEPPNLEEAAQEIERYQAFARKVGKAPMLMIPDKIFPPIGQDVRNLYREAAIGSPGIEAMATVVGGLVGLGASIISSIMTQIFQGRADIPMRTIRDVDEAASWLCSVADVQAKPPEIIAAVEQLRART